MTNDELLAAETLCTELRSWGRGTIWHYPPRMDVDNNKPKIPTARRLVAALEALESKIELARRKADGQKAPPA